MTIVCTGSIAYDYLMSFPGYFRDHILPDHLDSISLSFLVDSMVKQRGGTAPNIAYTLALLGEKPYVLGTVGEDFEDFRHFLEGKGVNTEFIRVIPGEFTASFFANTDLSNAQIASFYTGAMAHAGEVSINEIKDKQPELVVISPNDPKAMRQYCEECKALHIPYLYDPSQQIVRVDVEDIRVGVENCESLFLNDYEYELLQKRTGLTPKEILSRIKFMVVTAGEAGAVVYSGDDKFMIPIVPPEKIADPTGVGDAFRGGFLRGYRKGFDWQTCGQMGSLAATYCLEQRGTQNHSYTPQQFIERYRKHFDDKGVLDTLVE
jgi:adenosine kinase